MLANKAFAMDFTAVSGKSEGTDYLPIATLNARYTSEGRLTYSDSIHDYALYQENRDIVSADKKEFEEYVEGFFTVKK